MILKKYLKRGQVALEYIILFTAIMSLGLVSASTFLPGLRETMYGSSSQPGYFKAATDRLVNADGGSYPINLPQYVPLPDPDLIPPDAVPISTSGVYTGTVPANGVYHYYIVTQKPYSRINVSLANPTRRTNVDLIVSDLRQPAASDIVGRTSSGPDFWYNTRTGTNTENVVINQETGLGAVIYITVINRSAQPVNFRVNWSGTCV